MTCSLARGAGGIRPTLADIGESALRLVPTALAFITILAAGWALARIVRRVVPPALRRVGFDRAVERGGVARAPGHLRPAPSDLVATLAYLVVLLCALRFAAGIRGPNEVSDLLGEVVGWLPRGLVAVVIAAVAAVVANAVREFLTVALHGLSCVRPLARGTSISIVALGVIAALGQAGIATTVTQPILIAALATVAGILIVGVGGGLVRPMQRRWDGWLRRAAAESRLLRERRRADQTDRDGPLDGDPVRFIPAIDALPALAGAGRAPYRTRSGVAASPGAARPIGVRAGPASAVRRRTVRVQRPGRSSSPMTISGGFPAWPAGRAGGERRRRDRQR